jgi:3-oxoacyl-[acyl-carrier-protein] synthase II
MSWPRSPARSGSAGTAVPSRVVITGCGVLTAAGATLEEFWDALATGRCLIKPLQNFSAPEMPMLHGAEVDLGPVEALPARTDRDARRSRCTHLALAVAQRALAHAGLLESRSLLADAGIVLGTTMGEERQVGDLSEHWAAEGPDCIDGSFFDRADNHRLAALIAAQHGLGGPVILNTTACSSGNAVQAWAYDLVAGGEVEVVLAGAVDTFTRLLYNGFGRMGALAKSVCRPFDRARDGVAFGEGAALLVFESMAHAEARGARILAEVAGYGISNDAHHITAPDPTGAGTARAIAHALDRSGLGKHEVGYICAHGTGTSYNDQAEVRAIKAIFGEHAASIPISSPKSIVGHTNGAAGALASVACTLALIHQSVPPTANLGEPDPEFGLDFVAGQARPAHIESCLNLSAGFGGFNACVALRKAA